jgi:hypothetical protein
MAIVYQHRRRDTNEVFYIGIGKSENRAYKLNNRNRHWIHIADKVGWEVDILLEGIYWKDACKIEKGMIADYGRRDLGTGQLVNMTGGGEGVINPSEETRKKIGNANRGRVHTIEEIEKRKKSRSGYRPSEETKQKISRSRIGAKHSKDTIFKMSQAATGRKGTNVGKVFSKDWCTNISKAKVGYKHREETKEKMIGLFTTVACPFCKKEGQETAMKRWHFNNCKKATNE